MPESLPPYPCPMAECPGFVFVRSFGQFKGFGCDGPELHSDSQVRDSFLAESWAEENRAEMSAIERRIDPVAWLHDRLDEAKRPGEVKIHNKSLNDVEHLPRYATGFIGREVGALIDLRGMTTLSGFPSSGKSWFALGVAINSALDGWDVHYLAAEASDVIARRVRHTFGDNPPPRFHLHSAEPGIKPKDLIQEIQGWVRSTRTLLVIDSISTLLGLMRIGSNADKWDAQDSLEMFLMRVRELTHGEVGILNISEANAQGVSKGRVIDHRSDISINFKSLEDSDAKEVRVTKAWESHTGLIGRAHVAPDGPGLELIYGGPSAYAEQENEGDEF